jgi:hypothetical protein
MRDVTYASPALHINAHPTLPWKTGASAVPLAEHDNGTMKN